MKQTILIIMLALVLSACGAGNAGAPTDEATSSAVNAYATAFAAPRTNNTTMTSGQPSNGGVATATAVFSGSATELVVTPIESSTPVISATPTATAKPRPRPTATATGPLTFIGMGIYVANCRFTPTADKPGQIVIQISIEVMGGTGAYQYFDNEGKVWPTKFIDVLSEKGTASIGKVKVTSGDAQTIEKEYYIQPSDLTCS
jgi:hypothetical protein